MGDSLSCSILLFIQQIFATAVQQRCGALWLILPAFQPISRAKPWK